MPIVMDLGFVEDIGVGGIDDLQARHGGHDLPSFRPSRRKPYVLLVWLDCGYRGVEARASGALDCCSYGCCEL